jgi:hypothetical protein
MIIAGNYLWDGWMDWWLDGWEVYGLTDEEIKINENRKSIS